MNYSSNQLSPDSFDQLINNMGQSLFSTRDRFIPNREISRWNQNILFNDITDNARKESKYQKQLTNALFNNKHQQKLFKKKSQDKQNIGGFIQNIIRENNTHDQVDTIKRQITSIPDRILDAPDIEDNYYLNLMDWSSWGQLGICLRGKVYLYTPASIEQLYQEEPNVNVCSISFHPTDKMTAIGTSDGKIRIFDLEKNIETQVIQAHQNRVSSLSFSNILVSGSKDSQIYGYDLRKPDSIVRKFVGHKGQICGIKNSSAGLVSGSNDNLAIVWDIGSGKVRQKLKGHKAAVKALAWCPWQRNLLATGGGATDQTMRFWNVDTGMCIDKVNTQSQVCSLIWSPRQKQILSSHGFSENQLCLWKYPNLTKIQQLKGHTQRVLQMALSPDESTVCSASADQTLRFWKIFKEKSSEHEFQGKYLDCNNYSYTLR